jgi:hypothetical protein
MVLHVIHLVEEFAAVAFGDSRVPALVPNGDGVGIRLVSLFADVLGDIHCPVERF